MQLPVHFYGTLTKVLLIKYMISIQQNPLTPIDRRPGSHSQDFDFANELVTTSCHQPTLAARSCQTY